MRFQFIFQFFLIFLMLSACSGNSESGSGGNGGNSNSQPQFTSAATQQSMENNLATGYTATATDTDSDKLSFTVSGGADQSYFDINIDSGALVFTSVPDFENPMDSNHDNIYEVQLTVSDSKASDTLLLMVTVTDDPSDNVVNNAPVFTSATTASMMENQTSTGYSATATDADKDPLAFSIVGGADKAFFTIGVNSGVLDFKVAPDYEIPGDSNADNVYDVQLSVSDGKTSAFLTIAVTVTDDPSDNPPNKAPYYTSALTVIIDENQTDTGYRATATDAEGDPLTYSISGGVDKAFFNINSSTGELTFVSAPDFENPLDSDAANDYQVEITVTDNLSTPPSPATVVVFVIDVKDESGVAPTQLSLPKTGQVSCFDQAGTSVACAGTGQDGDAQAGIGWPVERFYQHVIDYSVTYDRLTNLMWLTYRGPIPGRDPLIPDSGISWQQSLDVISQLNLEHYRGFSDWRMANTNELLTLKNYEGWPAFHWTSSNTNCSDSKDWSSTTMFESPDMAWFASGSWLAWEAKSTTSYAPCYRIVRGHSDSALSAISATGQTQCYSEAGSLVSCAGSGQDGEFQAGVKAAALRFVANVDTSITDTLTGLIWAPDANLMLSQDSTWDTDGVSDGMVTWQHALDYVSKLNTDNYLGHSDWRLPNILELHSLVRADIETDLWLANQGFANVGTFYWSSTSFHSLPSSAWNILIGRVFPPDYIGFYNDYTSWTIKTNLYYVWPVRGP